MLIHNNLNPGDDSVAGASITDTCEGRESVVIKFENGVSWEISLKDDAYSGPEAMLLEIPGEPTVVWRQGDD
jgi:hypothetical protein